MTMTKTMTIKIAKSAILSAKMVGKKVIILKFSLESIDHDNYHDHDHDHDHDHEIAIKAILSARMVGEKGKYAQI